jgi:hypothetical protein
MLISDTIECFQIQGYKIVKDGYNITVDLLEEDKM